MTTELPAADALFRTVFEAAPDGILAVDARGTILLANAAATRMFGYAEEELRGMSVDLLVPAAARPAHAGHREAFGAAPRVRTMGTGLELSGLRKDGGELPVEIMLSGTKLGGEPVTLAIVRDATERRRAARALREAVDAAAIANRELEAFSYSVAHDLRAPLRAIDGFSQALLEDYGEVVDSTGNDYLGRVRAAAQRMARLIDDLLALSRVTRSELRRERVEISRIAEEAAARVRQLHPGRQVELSVQPALAAEADARLVAIVLDNLLGNAWKFTARSDVAHVSVGADPSGAFFVADDGAGFDMRYADQLFAPFKRLHGHAEFEGTGIGLATVQRIVHRHGGRIWAESQPGLGAKFSFTLGQPGRE